LLRGGRAGKDESESGNGSRKQLACDHDVSSSLIPAWRGVQAC